MQHDDERPLEDPDKAPEPPRMNPNPRLSRIRLRNQTRLLTLCGAADRPDPE